MTRLAGLKGCSVALPPNSAADPSTNRAVWTDPTRFVAGASSTPRSEKLPSPAKSIQLPIRDVTPFTTIDFPGRLAAVLYTQGCAWRCRYCYNSDFWPFETKAKLIRWSEILSFLESRKGLLDGVVFCGGEPISHAALDQAMAAVREMGFEVGLHTSGMFPDKLKHILSYCDWVGMDVKAPFSDYEKITRVSKSGEHAQASVQIILESGVEHEFRTTVHPVLLSEEEILKIGQQLSAMGAQHFVLQTFFAKDCLDEQLNSRPIQSQWVSPSLNQFFQSRFKSFQIR